MARFSVNPQRFDPYKNFTVGASRCAGHDLQLDRWMEELALLTLRYYLAPPDIRTAQVAPDAPDPSGS